MSDTVVVPATTRRRPGLFVPPLLLIPFLIYNILAYTLYGGQPTGWANQVFQVRMVSGTEWALTAGDVLLVVGLICLFFELIKSTNVGRSSLVEHMLSTGLFVIFLVEFLLAGAAASSVFFLLMIMSIVDVIAGFTIAVVGSRREVNVQ